MAGSKHISVDTKTNKVTDQILDLVDVLLTLGGFTVESSGGVKTIGLGATHGVKVGATGDKIGFLGAAPVSRPTGNLLTALSALGLVGSPSLTVANITSLQAFLDALAPLASPAFTGAPTAPTAATDNSSTQLATTAFVHAIIAAVVGASPATLDTIRELADAIGDDPNFAVTVANAVTAKLSKSANLSDLTDVVAARANLGLDQLANDAEVVHNTGAEDIAGPKSFLDPVGVYSLTGNSITANVLATPAAPTVTPIGSAEGVTRGYKIVALLSDGAFTAASPAGATTHGDETLDATNNISLTWPAVPGAVLYHVYRLANDGTSPVSIGRIASVLTNAYIDTGAAGDGSTPPTHNTTGRATGSLFDKGGAFFNVKAFGATGDGVTDDTAAVAATYAAALAESSGGHVFYPPGDFKVLNLPAISSSAPLTISGTGWSSKILWAGTDHLFSWTVRAINLHIANLFISPQVAANATHDIFHFGMGCTDSTFDRISLDQAAPFKARDVFNLSSGVAQGEIARVTANVLLSNCFLFNYTGAAARIGWGARVTALNFHALAQGAAGSIGIYLVGDNGGVTVEASDLLGNETGLWTDQGNYIYGTDAAGFPGRTVGQPLLTNREIFLGVCVNCDTCVIGKRVSDGCRLTWMGVWACACSKYCILVEDGSPDLVYVGGRIFNAGANGPAPGVTAAHGMEMRSGSLMMTGTIIEHCYQPSVPLPGGGTGPNNGKGMIIGPAVNISSILGCRSTVNYQGLEHAGPNHSVMCNIFDSNLTRNSVIAGGESQYHLNLFSGGANEGETDGHPRKTYTVNPTAGNGQAFTLAEGFGRYERIGKEYRVNIVVLITTKGPADGYVQVPLPAPVINPLYLTGFGVENGITGKPLAVQAQGDSAVIIRFGDLSSPIANGARCVINVNYEGA